MQVIKPHVATYKKRIASEISKLIEENPIIGVLNVENLPAPQFQKMRAILRDKVVIRMAKRRLIKIAIKNVREKKKGIEELEKHLVGMPALIFTKDNPFNLSKILKKSKSKAPAKAGQIAPYDIVVQAGPTPFAPGPVIGELNSIGIKTGVEGGKVTIARETTVVKNGENISAKVANILSRLGITPMEIGLELVAVYEDGIVFTKDVLMIDEEGYITKLGSVANESFNLSVSIGYATKENVTTLIKKAFNDAKALAISQEIISDETIKIMLSRAERQMLSLKNSAKIEIVERNGGEAVKKAGRGKIEYKEKLQTLKDIKTEGIEMKEIIKEEDMKKAEEFVKRLQKGELE